MSENKILGELSKDFFSSRIKHIVENNHTLHAKQNLRIYNKRINFACPICGDSETNPSNYRGNVWLNSMMFVCFNCGVKKSFTKFCDDFNEPIDLEDKIKIYNYIDSKSFSNDDYSIKSLDKLINIKEWMEFMNKHPKSWLNNISEVKSGSVVHQYLTIGRNLHNHQSIYQGIYRKFRENGKVWQTPVMISLNRSNDSLLGIQLRNLEKDRTKRFYKIIEFEDLYNFMNPTKILDDFESIPYNKLSHFYNILNVDFDKKITIFEGFIDSLFYNINGQINSIGMVGANNDKDLLKFLTEADDDLELQFFYDNDNGGNRKAVKMLERGYPVFLWKLLFNKIIEDSTNGYQSESRLKHIIDLNDLVNFYENPNIVNEFKLKNFFSKDSFDKIYFNELHTR